MTEPKREFVTTIITIRRFEPTPWCSCCGRPDHLGVAS